MSSQTQPVERLINASDAEGNTSTIRRRNSGQQKVRDQCMNAFDTISRLTWGRIVNEDLIQAQFAVENNTRVKNYTNKLRTGVVKIWLALVILICLEARLFYAHFSRDEDSRESSPNAHPSFLNSLIFAGIVIVMIYYLEKKILGRIKGHLTVARLVLDRQQADQYEKDYYFDRVIQQTQNRNANGSFRLIFPDPQLEQAFKANIDTFEHDALIRGLFCVKNNVYDCVGIAALVILKLVEMQLPYRIERLFTINQGEQGHSYVVVNRTQGRLHDFSSWNDDCVIVDPWYGICEDVKSIKNQPDFFNNHPLLAPNNKQCHCAIIGNQAPSCYPIYLDKLTTLLEGNNNRNILTTYWQDLTATLPDASAANQRMSGQRRFNP